MSTANVVRLYLKNKPYMMEALESGIVNLSALSRLIQKDLRIRNFQAVKAAVRRYSEEIGKVKQGIEARALSVLRGNRVTLLDGIAVIITDKDIDIKNSAKVRVDQYYVYLTDKNEIAKIKGKTNIIKRYENCSVISIHSEENVESVSGVIAFVTSLFAEQNINIMELISCYTENILVISREDALKGYSLISDIIK